MQSNSDFNELVQAFNAAGVRFLVIGAYAVAFYSRPRATGDFDVWIAHDSDNAGRVYRALAAFGAPVVGLSSADFADPDVIYQIGVAPHRVDVVTGIDGVEFEDCWTRRRLGAIDSIPVHFIDRDDLLINKKASGRPKDLMDITRLTKDR